MRRFRAPAVACVLALGPTAAPAAAQSLDEAATHAAPQHYLITLPPTPVAEVAEIVLGQSLGLPFKVDADVDATMSFRIDGLYAPTELVQELGYRLWNVDVVLIQRPSDGFWLIPEAELPAALSAGAIVVSPVASMPPAAPTKTMRAAPTKADARDAEPAGTLGAMGLLLLGWLAGLGSALAWIAVKRRAMTTPPDPPRLSAPTAKAEDVAIDELTIPTFSPPPASLTATKGVIEA